MALDRIDSADAAGQNAQLLLRRADADVHPVFLALARCHRAQWNDCRDPVPGASVPHWGRHGAQYVVICNRLDAIYLVDQLRSHIDPRRLGSGPLSRQLAHMQR